MTVALPRIVFRSEPNQAPCHPATSTFPPIQLSLIGKSTYGLKVAPGPPPMRSRPHGSCRRRDTSSARGWRRCSPRRCRARSARRTGGWSNGGPSEPGVQPRPRIALLPTSTFPPTVTVPSVNASRQAPGAITRFPVHGQSRVRRHVAAAGDHEVAVAPRDRRHRPVRRTDRRPCGRVGHRRRSADRQRTAMHETTRNLTAWSCSPFIADRSPLIL